MFDLPAKDQLLTGKLLSNAKADFDPQTGAAGRVDDLQRPRRQAVQGTSRRSSPAQGKADYDTAKATDPTAQPLNYVRQFAVILDGALETYPYIDFQRTPDGIGKNSQITGVTAGEARDVATVLASGSLPVEFARLSQTQVSATLGKASLRQGLIAGLARPPDRDDLDGRLLPVPGRDRRHRAADLRGVVLRGDPRHPGDADACPASPA